MIKNLLFDLGGVIMDIEKERCVRAFDRLGLPDAKSYFGDYIQKPPFSLLEEGKINAPQFRDDIRKLLGYDATDAAIDEAFEHFLIGIPVERLHALRYLRRQYGIYLLSNTNPIMWDGFIRKQFAKDGGDINTYFDGIVTSFEALALKPSAAIFEYTAKKLGIDPGETLFLDDSAANCEAAVSLGWHAAHVKPGREFTHILAELNLLPGDMQQTTDEHIR